MSPPWSQPPSWPSPSWIDSYRRSLTSGLYFTAPPIESLVVAGSDRASFLHNLCSNDINRLTPGEAVEAFFLNVKGHVLAHAVVHCQADALVLHVLGSESHALASHLDRYLIREEVTLTAIDRPSCLLLGGSLLASTDASDLLTKNHSLAYPANLLHAPVALGLASDLHEGELTEERLLEEGYQAGNDKTWNALRVESGLALFDIDYGAGTLPQELSRTPWAISFNKGCYLGQETVARIDALGHVNKQITGVRFQGDKIPVVGTPLLANDQPVGSVTSSTWSPSLNAPLVLTMLRRAALDSPIQSSNSQGTVVPLPVVGC